MRPIDGSELVDRFCESDSGMPLSKEALQHLAELAFEVSLRPEEGRFPRPMFHVPAAKPGGSGGAGLLVRFEHAVSLDAGTMAKLAQIVPGRPYALHVSPRDGVLYCTGLGVVEKLWQRDLVKPAGIYVAVEGPGRLTVSGPGYPIVEWRGKEVRPVDDVSRSGFFQRACSQGLQKLKTAMGDSSAALDEFGLDDELERAIERMLGAAVATLRGAGTGGCMLILPQDGRGAEEVELSYLTRGPRLGVELLQRTAKRIGSGGRLDVVLTKSDLQDSVALARMASVDGCVVLNASLECLGFGGKLSRRDTPECREVSQLEALMLATVEDPLQVRGSPFPISRKGTRHQSAAEFCAAVPHAVAIVVSQDSDVTTMYSRDGGMVYVNSRLGTYVGWSGTIDSI